MMPSVKGNPLLDSKSGYGHTTRDYSCLHCIVWLTDVMF